jgi:hypothetical protein
VYTCSAESRERESNSFCLNESVASRRETESIIDGPALLCFFTAIAQYAKKRFIRVREQQESIRNNRQERRRSKREREREIVKTFHLSLCKCARVLLPSSFESIAFLTTALFARFALMEVRKCVERWKNVWSVQVNPFRVHYKIISRSSRSIGFVPHCN